jgi:ABC-type bacteriocin/lantibiotic exporter with double-glycine peptidase domain
MKWLNEDGGRIVFMFYMNWQLTWIVVVAVLVFITRIFQRKMQVLLRT